MSLLRWITICLPVETDDDGSTSLGDAVDFAATAASDALASEGWDVAEDKSLVGWTNIPGDQTASVKDCERLAMSDTLPERIEALLAAVAEERQHDDATCTHTPDCPSYVAEEEWRLAVSKVEAAGPDALATVKELYTALEWAFVAPVDGDGDCFRCGYKIPDEHETLEPHVCPEGFWTARERQGREALANAKKRLLPRLGGEG